MKTSKSLQCALGALMLGALAGCTQESGYLVDPDTKPVDNVVNLVKSPDITAYSGGRSLEDIANTYGADVNGNLWYQNWDRPTNVTDEEIAKITELMSTPRVGAVNDIHIEWENYWVQQVYTGEQTYVDGYGNNIGTGSSHMNHLLAYSNKKKVQNVVTWWDEETQGPIFEYEIKDKDPWEDVYEHVNNFNNGSNNTVYTDDETKEQYIGTTLMTDMYCPEDVIDQFGYHNSTDSKYHYEYIIVEMDGNYYVCFDFYATHPEGQDANKNMDVERDWVFNDWIVKISPAYLKGTTPEEKPNPDEPTTPDGPVISGDNAEVVEHVEVNLEVENHQDYTATHLSIHIRAITDVDVYIPVPKEYYCEADDMAIVQKHEQYFMTHGGPEVLTYDINGNEVVLTIKYEDNGILVSTQGVNESVIEYLKNRTGDGITFEIWNYYNETVTEEFVRNYLSSNIATVNFKNEPALYVNAFYFDDENGIVNDKKNPWDCIVDIVGSQKNDYKDGEAGYWYNNSPYNQLYYRKN